MLPSRAQEGYKMVGPDIQSLMQYRGGVKLALYLPNSGLEPDTPVQSEFAFTDRPTAV